MSFTPLPVGFTPPAAPVEYRLVANRSILESPYSRARQEIRHLGERWEVTFTWPVLKLEEWRIITGWLAELESWGFPALLPYYGYSRGGGVDYGAEGSVLATGTAGADTVSVTGITGTAPEFKRGDVIEIKQRLYRIIYDVTASGGAATLRILPRLRDTVSGQVVVFIAPYGKFQLDSPVIRRALPGNLAELEPVHFVEPLP